jgi:hypothetical protein
MPSQPLSPRSLHHRLAILLSSSSSAPHYNAPHSNVAGSSNLTHLCGRRSWSCFCCPRRRRRRLRRQSRHVSRNAAALMAVGCSSRMRLLGWPPHLASLSRLLAPPYLAALLAASLPPPPNAATSPPPDAALSPPCRRLAATSPSHLTSPPPCRLVSILPPVLAARSSSFVLAWCASPPFSSPRRLPAASPAPRRLAVTSPPPRLPRRLSPALPPRLGLVSAPCPHHRLGLAAASSTPRQRLANASPPTRPRLTSDSPPTRLRLSFASLLRLASASPGCRLSERVGGRYGRPATRGAATRAGDGETRQQAAPPPLPSQPQSAVHVCVHVRRHARVPCTARPSIEAAVTQHVCGSSTSQCVCAGARRCSSTSSYTIYRPKLCSPWEVLVDAALTTATPHTYEYTPSPDADADSLLGIPRTRRYFVTLCFSTCFSGFSGSNTINDKR